MNKDRGILLILLTALVSGFSIFINKFGVGGIDPSLFTTGKNIFVALGLSSFILILGEWDEFRKLGKSDWLKLLVIGLIGGSLPFLLFFSGLQSASVTSAAFIHKTMFIWVGILSLFLLKEKINRKWLIAAVLLLIGNALLLRLDWISLGEGEILILLATLFWAVESIISKHTLGTINPRLVAWGRMFFGAVFLLIYLGFTGQLTGFIDLTSPQLSWIILTSGLLFLYVITWYTGLAEVDASVATCILLMGSPVTTLLSIFTGTTITLSQGAGILLLLSGVVLVSFAYILKLIRGISFFRSEA